MRIIADFHLHSQYSRACSKELTLENNAKWCQKKGVNILGTADFTHPKWFAQIENQLIEAEPGLYKLRSGLYGEMRYILTTEVSQIYKRGGKTRRIHNIILAPSIKSVRKLNLWLANNGFNLKADGRPILGLDSEELYKRLKEIDEKIIIIPAHAWTPWYAVFGSKSGFDSIQECFGEMSPYIYAIETGLSSDPAMNWQLSALDEVVLISNSDAHSPRNLGREANVFEFDVAPTYDEFVRVLKEQDTTRFKYTIEFYPQEGKYHADGCAACQFSCEPKESRRLGERCPTCKRPLTLGVHHRVEALSDRASQTVKDRKIPFKSIVPLAELVAEVLQVKSTQSKKVEEIYTHLTQTIGNEFTLLLDTPIEDIQAHARGTDIARAIERMRAGNLQITPGYDGIFGTVRIFSER